MMPQQPPQNEILEELFSGAKIFIHSIAAAPQILIEELIRTAKEKNLRGIEIYQIHTEGNCDYALPHFHEHFKVHSFFNGSNIRKAREGNLRDVYVPIFLSAIPDLFYRKSIELDFAFIQVSTPDEHGFCSLGPSVDVTMSAVRTAKKIIAEMNDHMPRTFGEQLHLSKIHRWMLTSYPLHELHAKPMNAVDQQIGKNVAELIPDGATLQLGIGNIPNAVLSNLLNHKNLGIHSEMISDGILPLVEKGVINGRFKVKHPEKIVTSFVHGSQKIYDFIHNNPQVLILDCAYTNRVSIIAQNPQVMAINSAIEIDLTGQVCADSIGMKIHSGIGGQMDFMRGANLSPGGKPIIAMPSLSKNGESKIVPFLKMGAGVVTTRAHVHYVVTEYGVARLFGKTIRERAKELLNIAHPHHREQIEKQFFEMKP